MSSHKQQQSNVNDSGNSSDAHIRHSFNNRTGPQQRTTPNNGSPTAPDNLQRNEGTSPHPVQTPVTVLGGFITVHPGGRLHKAMDLMTKENWLVIASILFYFGASISLTMFNKWFFAVAPRSTDATAEAEVVVGVAGTAVPEFLGADGQKYYPATRIPPASSPTSTGNGESSGHMFSSGSKGVSSLGFHFPLTVTCIHQLLVWVFLIVLEKRVITPFAGEIQRGRHIMKSVVPVGLLCGLDWGLSNSALRSITLSLYELVKACTPLLVLFLSSILGLQRMTKQTVGIMVLVSVGMVLSVSGGDIRIFSQANFPMVGFTCVTVAACLGATRVVLAQRVLQKPVVTQTEASPTDESEPNAPAVVESERVQENGSIAAAPPSAPPTANNGYNAVTVLYYAAPASAGALVLPAFVFEGRAVYSWFGHASTPQVLAVFSLVTASTCLAFLLSISEFVVTRKTSALSLCIAGIGKQVLIVGLAMVLFGDRLKFANMFGFALTLTGIFLYNRLKFQERVKQQEEETEAAKLVAASRGREELSEF